MSNEDEKVETLNFTTEDFIRLKEFFKETINSNRRFEQISTIEELYTVLEDRDALTDDDLKGYEPNFCKFVLSQRKKNNSVKELFIPQNVVNLICENCQDEWKNVGRHLKLTEEQLGQCENLQDVLLKFTKNCIGISFREMIFRLTRALEKSNKGTLKPQVTELMLQKYQN